MCDLCRGVLTRSSARGGGNAAAAEINRSRAGCLTDWARIALASGGSRRRKARKTEFRWHISLVIPERTPVRCRTHSIEQHSVARRERGPTIGAPAATCSTHRVATTNRKRRRCSRGREAVKRARDHLSSPGASSRQCESESAYIHRADVGGNDSFAVLVPVVPASGSDAAERRFAEADERCFAEIIRNGGVDAVCNRDPGRRKGPTAPRAVQRLATASTKVRELRCLDPVVQEKDGSTPPPPGWPRAARHRRLACERPQLAPGRRGRDDQPRDADGGAENIATRLSWCDSGGVNRPGKGSGKEGGQRPGPGEDFTRGSRPVGGDRRAWRDIDAPHPPIRLWRAQWRAHASCSPPEPRSARSTRSRSYFIRQGRCEPRSTSV